MNKHQQIAIRQAIAQLEKYAYTPTVDLLKAALENNHTAMLQNEVYKMK